VTQRDHRALHKRAYFKTDEFEFHAHRLMTSAAHGIDVDQGSPPVVDQAAW
jgi:hypothetical protein